MLTQTTTDLIPQMPKAKRPELEVHAMLVVDAKMLRPALTFGSAPAELENAPSKEEDA